MADDYLTYNFKNNSYNDKAIKKQEINFNASNEKLNILKNNNKISFFSTIIIRKYSFSFIFNVNFIF